MENNNRQSYAESREELLSGGTVKIGEDQRERMSQATSSVERAGDNLARAKEIAFETIEIGGGTIDDLYEQRSTMERAREKLANINAELQKARRSMGVIAQHLRQHMILLALIVIILLIALAVVVYFIFFS